MGNDIFDVFDPNLPDELIAQIGTKDDAEDRKIIDLFDRAKRPLNVKEVLVGYYNVHKEIKPKRFIMGKLYRLARKNVLISTEKKGTYKLAREANKNDDLV